MFLSVENIEGNAPMIEVSVFITWLTLFELHVTSFGKVASAVFLVPSALSMAIANSNRIKRSFDKNGLSSGNSKSSEPSEVILPCFFNTSKIWVWITLSILT